MTTTHKSLNDGIGIRNLTAHEDYLNREVSIIDIEGNQYEDNGIGNVLEIIDEVYLAMDGDQQQMIKIFDSGASHTMSGNRNRIVNERVIEKRVMGFNGNIRRASVVGVNEDGINELFVDSMPENLALLSAYQYNKNNRFTVLNEDGGGIYSTNSKGRGELMNYIDKNFKLDKRLKVKNGIYVIEEDDNEHVSAYTASTTFFNHKVHVVNNKERILALLLCGFSYGDLIKILQHHSLGGIPQEITLSDIYRFGRIFGATPNIVKLAYPRNEPNHKGLMEDPPELVHVGQLVEVDIMEPEYNNEVNINDEKKSKRSTKLPTWGGATSAVVMIDTYSGYIIGKLLKSTANPHIFVKELVETYSLYSNKIVELAADSGIITNNFWGIHTPETVRYLNSMGIKHKRSAPYNHNIGTPTVENAITTIKDLSRMAFIFILRNPSLKCLKFSELDIYKLWGEIFYWSIELINMRPCPHDETVSRYEKFHNKKPNIQSTRILPIFSFVQVPDRTESITKHRKDIIGLYVGPKTDVRGGIKVAVKHQGSVNILITTKYPSVSLGGTLDVYNEIEKGIANIPLSNNVEDTNDTTVEEVINDRSKSDELDEHSITLKEEVLDTEEVDKRVSSSNRKRKKNIVDGNLNKKILTTYETSNSITKDDNTLLVDSEESSDIKLRNAKKVDTTKFIGSGRNTKQIGKNQSANLKKLSTTKVQKIMDSIKNKIHMKANPRSKRIIRDNKRYKGIDYVNMCLEELDGLCFDIEDFNYYWNEKEKAYYAIDYAYKAVTTGIPKNYTDALNDEKWKEPACKEWNTLIDTGAIVPCNRDTAREQIRKGEADLIFLFPVYEKKSERWCNSV